MSTNRPTRVSIDGYELNDVDNLGVQWLFTSIEGWHRPTGVDVAQVQRPTHHGQFPQQGRRLGRVVTINGRIQSADRQALAVAIGRLNAILAGGEFGLFQFVDRTDGTRWATAQLGPNAVRLAWDGSPVVFYQLELLMPSPYKYGATDTAGPVGFAVAPVGAGLVFPLFPSPSTLDFGASGGSGVVTVTNGGNAPAPVVFTVAGPTPAGGFTIVDAATSKSINYLGAVPSGSTLVLDGADGSVTIDGTADRLGDTIVQAWPTIAAGASADFLFNPNGTQTAATLTASCVATYW